MKNNLTNGRSTKHPAWLPDFCGTAMVGWGQAAK